MRVFDLIVFFLLASLTAVRADSLSSIPIEKCNFTAAFEVLYIQSVRREARNAEQVIRLTPQIKSLISKAMDLKVPLQDALTKQEMANFGQLQQQLQAAQMVWLVESRYQTNLDILEKMVQLNNQLYQGIYPPNPDHESKKIIVFLYKIGTALPRVKSSTSTHRNCCGWSTFG